MIADTEEVITDKEQYENLRKQMNYALIKVRFPARGMAPGLRWRRAGGRREPTHHKAGRAAATSDAGVSALRAPITCGPIAASVGGPLMGTDHTPRRSSPQPTPAADPHTDPLLQNCDMNEEMRQDCVDVVITACERFAGNFEVRGRRGTCRDGATNGVCSGGRSAAHWPSA